MYTRRNYGFWMTLNWSKTPLIYGFFYALAVSLLYYVLKKYTGLSLALPWQPISVLGIAVAFYLGFKNNASYDRTWEARKIWGGLVNSSRTFGAAVCAFVHGENAEQIKRELIYRHIAWLTALRYQLRLAREWEHAEARVGNLYSPNISEEFFEKLDKEMLNYISEKELKNYTGRANIATQVMRHQAEVLQGLRNKGYFDDFRHMELQRLIALFYDDQGRSERIKNFPFPRQYASTALWQTFIFAALIPFGMLNVFSDEKESMFWLAAPFSALTTWVFFLMEKIGDYSENPFEGSYNDVPITSISRSIEIDLRQMINDENIPDPVKNENGFVM